MQVTLNISTTISPESVSSLRVSVCLYVAYLHKVLDVYPIVQHMYTTCDRTCTIINTELFHRINMLSTAECLIVVELLIIFTL